LTRRGVLRGQRATSSGAAQQCVGGGPLCSHQQRPHFVPRSVLHFSPIQRSPPTSPLKHFCLNLPLFHWTYLNSCCLGTPRLTCGLQLHPISCGATARSGPGSHHYRGFTMAFRHTTLGRTHLDE